MSRALIGLLLLASSALVGCASERWQYATVRGVNRQLVWQASLDVMYEKGRFPGIDIADVDGGSAMTKWREELGVFHNKGERRRAHLTLEEAGSDAYIVGMRIEREINSAWRNTLESEGAEWDSGDDDPEEAQTLLFHLQVLLQATRGTESEDFKRRYERRALR
ncbi:MAG: hypothetical protein RL885_27650 [Planctomycetota bacterium]